MIVQLKMVHPNWLTPMNLNYVLCTIIFYMIFAKGRLWDIITIYEVIYIMLLLLGWGIMRGLANMTCDHFHLVPMSKIGNREVLEP